VRSARSGDGVVISFDPKENDMSAYRFSSRWLPLPLAVALLAVPVGPALADDDPIAQLNEQSTQTQRSAAEQYRPGLPDDAVNLQPVLPQDFDACSAPLAPHEGGHGPKPGQDAPVLAHGGDISFSGHRAFVACGADSGSLHDDGFAVVDIKDPAAPRVISRFACVASSSDIAVYGDLVFLATDTNNDTVLVPTGGLNRPWEYRAPVLGSGEECQEDIASWTPGAAEPPRFFRGVRVISIADVRQPRVIKSIATPDPKEPARAPHNLTLVPELDHVDELGEPEPRVVVLLADPAAGGNWIVTVPLDQDEQHLADLVRNAAGTAREWGGRRCHDIAVFLPRRLAACNQNSVWRTQLLTFEGSIVDAKVITTLRSPHDDLREMRAHRNPPFHDGHHSSAFSWDGNRLLVTPESYRPNPVCNQDGGEVSFGLYVYDISDLENPVMIGHHQRPPALAGDFCTAKQLSVIPLRSGRAVAAVSWLGGGTSLVDFTTTKTEAGYEPAVELGRFLAEAGGSNKSYAWASHWYNGHVYVNNAFGCISGACVGTATRGLDVLALRFDGPKVHAEMADAVKLDRFDFGLQQCHDGLLEQAWAAHLTGCPAQAAQAAQAAQDVSPQAAPQDESAAAEEGPGS
jgi:hypothetical protein